MKKLASFLSVILIICSSCQKKEVTKFDSFTVSGTITGLSSDFMTRSYKDAEGNRVSDSIMVKNESFTYTTKINEPTFIVFWPNVERTIKRTDKGYYPAKSSQLAFLASPGDNIVFKGEVTDFINAYPSGTDTNTNLSKINSQIFPLLNNSVNLLLKKDKLSNTDSQYKSLEDSIMFIDSKVLEFKKAFINSNPNSKAAIWYLSDMMLRHQISDNEAISAFKKFDNTLIDYPFYKEVATRIDGIKATQIGKTVENFTTSETFTGESFEFNSLKGKYVMIDFWGTWCGPCVAEMPKVKEYQERYKDKLVVLGVNQGDTKERIAKFIQSNDYDWTHLINGKADSDFVSKFNVAGFPTKFIIAPNGKILNRFVGNGEESFIVLDSLLVQ